MQANSKSAVLFYEMKYKIQWLLKSYLHFTDKMYLDLYLNLRL